MTLPNKITIGRSILGPLFLFLLLNFSEYLSIAVMFIQIITDALDGYLARRRREVTVLGRNLDVIIDNLFFTFAFLALTLKFNLPWLLLWFLILQVFFILGNLPFFVRFKNLKILRGRVKGLHGILLYLVITATIFNFYLYYSIIFASVVAFINAFDVFLNRLRYQHEVS